jgi:hypothetical protein
MTTVIPLIAKLIADTKQYNKDMESAKRPADELASSLSGAGVKLTAGLTLPLIGAGIAATNYASDQGEAINAANVVFGEHVGKLNEFSENVATTAGLSKTEFFQMGAEIGSVLSGMGLDLGTASEKTVDLTARAADMASIFNTDVSEAMGALKSGLTGQGEPLRRFGVNLSDATMKAYALEQGIWDGEGAMTEEEKTLARLGVIFEQTDVIEGDFVNTSGDVANASRIAEARFKDQAAELGGRLIPIKLRLIEVVTKVLDWFDRLSEGQKDNIVTIAGLVAVIGPLLLVLGKVIGLVNTLWPIIVTLTTSGVLPLVAAVGLMIAAWRGIVLQVGRLWDIITGKKNLLTELKADFDKVAGAVQWLIDKVKGVIDWLSKIKIPPILQGKSPSPFEKSLMGISGALDDISRKQIPLFAGVAMGGGGSTNHYYLQGRYQYESQESIVDKLRVMERLQ